MEEILIMDNSKGRNNAREVRLADLVIEILLHWRGIIIAILLGGILMGGISYLSSAWRAQTTVEKVDLHADEKQLVERLTDTEANDVNRAVLYWQLYENNLFYQQHSVVMQADPNNVSREEFVFFIRSDNMERSYNIERIYEEIATSTGLYDYLKETCNADNDVSEIIVLERASNDQIQGGNDSFKMVVLHYDEEICNNIADAVLEYMNQQSETLQQSLGDHELILLDRAYSTVFMEEYLERQREIIIQLMEYGTAYTNLKKEFTDEQVSYYNYLISDKSIDNLSSETIGIDTGVQSEELIQSTAPPRISIKYVAMGSLFFVIAFISFLLICYMLNNRIRIDDSFTELYGIPQLGIIPRKPETRKRLFDFVDKFISSFRDRSKRQFTFEDALNLASASIKISVGRDGIKEVTLIGCNLKGQAMDTCKLLNDSLTADGIQVEVLNNVIYDAQAMGDLEKAKGVVLVETAGSTFYDEVQQEIELLQRQDINILGGIMVA